MKILLFAIGIFISNHSISQIPDLARRTLTLKLKKKDFASKKETLEKKYMVNVDTLNFGKETISGEITWYKTRKGMLKKINQFLVVVKDKKIEIFKEYKDNVPYFNRVHHMWAKIENYRIDWWFLNSTPDKLETITIVKPN